jgi:hypothetical protein
MSSGNDGQINHLDKEEWWDVARSIDPTISRQQFEADWAEFLKMKAAKQLS